MSGGFWVGPHDEPDRIRLGPAVASGAEGVLYRGVLASQGGPLDVAVKMLQPGHLDRLAEWTLRWRVQVELLEGVEVPGLVAVRGGFVGPLPHPQGNADPSTSSLYLVMDWVEGVSLDRWARSLEEPDPEQLLLALVPVAVALDLLHSGAATGGVTVVHRDVKPANILIRPDGDTVLVDIGSVRGLVDDSRRSGVVGTPGYVAPEVRLDGDYGPAADRYSLGAVAFFLLTGSEPPVEPNADDLRQRLVESPIVTGRPDVVDHVLGMLHSDPDSRPTPLANWVAQLRASSLVGLSGETTGLAPRAPRRHPGSRPGLGRCRHWIRRRSPARRLVLVFMLLITLVAGGVLSLKQRDRRPPSPRNLAGAGGVTLVAASGRSVELTDLRRTMTRRIELSQLPGAHGAEISGLLVEGDTAVLIWRWQQGPEAYAFPLTFVGPGRSLGVATHVLPSTAPGRVLLLNEEEDKGVQSMYPPVLASTVREVDLKGSGAPRSMPVPPRRRVIGAIRSGLILADEGDDSLGAIEIWDPSTTSVARKLSRRAFSVASGDDIHVWTQPPFTELHITDGDTGRDRTVPAPQGQAFTGLGSLAPDGRHGMFEVTDKNESPASAPLVMADGPAPLGRWASLDLAAGVITVVEDSNHTASETVSSWSPTGDVFFFQRSERLLGVLNPEGPDVLPDLPAPLTIDGWLTTFPSDLAPLPADASDVNSRVTTVLQPTLAYVRSNREGLAQDCIRVVPVNGDQPRTLTCPTGLAASVGPVGNVLWSPDGTKLAFDTRSTEMVWIMNADGSDVRRVASGGTLNRVNSWSPDSQQLAVSRSNGDGSYAVQLVSIGGEQLAQVHTSKRMFNAVAWSPDGERLLVGVDEGGTCTSRLYTIDVAGGNLDDLGCSISGYSWSPGVSWHPSGNTVLFVRSGGDTLVSVNTDGSGERLMHTGKDLKVPAWSPDGTEVLVIGSVGLHDELFVLNADGSGVHQVSSGSVSVNDPAWSMDGSDIAYEAAGDIWISPSTGGPARQITHERLQNRLPRWKPA